MKHYKNITVSWSEERQRGRYYDPVNKTEGDGEIPEGCVPIGDTEAYTVKLKYRIAKTDVKLHGELVENDE